MRVERVTDGQIPLHREGHDGQNGGVGGPEIKTEKNVIVRSVRSCLGSPD